MDKEIGIYKITNIKNNKVYIGSSENLYKRQIDHFGLLRRNKHHSIHLQRAWNRTLNPEESFKFEILENCKKEELLEKENYYLNYYCKSKDYINNINKDFLKLSYNILPLAIDGFSGKHRKETINKMIMNHPLRKNILCFNLNGILYKEYISSNEASKDLKISRSAILKLCKTKRYIGKKYIFGFKEDLEFLDFIEKSEKPIIYKIWNKNKKYSEEQKSKLSWVTKIKVTNLTTNEQLEFYSQKKACEYFNLQPCTVNLCLKKKKPYRKKLLFEFMI
jgi:hypothetical protein